MNYKKFLCDIQIYCDYDNTNNNDNVMINTRYRYFFCLFKYNLYLCSRNSYIMATAIKETPILYGEDAKRFLARMKEKRTETPEQKAKRLAAYEAVMSVADF